MDSHEEALLDTDEHTTDDDHTHDPRPIAVPRTDDDHTHDPRPIAVAVPRTDDDHTHDPRPIAVPGKLGEFLINMVSVEPSLFKRKKEGKEDTNIYLPLDCLFVLHGDYARIVPGTNTTLNVEIVAFEAIIANAFVAGLGDFEEFKQVKCG